jgi:hypothetical protein
LGNISVYCDIKEGGRTVIQRPFNGDVELAHGYDDYIDGFGDVSGDHWLGLEIMHLLITRPGATNSLLIAVYQYNIYTRMYMKHANVLVDDRESGYKLHVTLSDQDTSSSDLTSNLWKGESLTASDGWAFTTLDHDVDGKKTANCASKNGGGGGWW